MRTNIDIDDKLMKQAMKATGTNTKRAAVDAALRKLLDVKARERALERAMRLQEADRLTAIREGRLEEWFAELERTGTRFLEDTADANQY
jgi:Arc/MetJ family transcription regulator